MNLGKVKEILGEGTIQPDGTLRNPGMYLYWDPRSVDRIVLDGEFSQEELEAILWHIKLMKKLGAHYLVQKLSDEISGDQEIEPGG